MSQQQTPCHAISLVAPSTVAARRFVKATGALAGENTNAIGVSQEAAAAGEAYSAVTLGTAFVEASAAIAADKRVGSDATGRAAEVDGDTITVALGRTVEAVAGEGHFVEVHLIPN